MITTIFLAFSTRVAVAYHFFRDSRPCGALCNAATTSAIVSSPCEWVHSKVIVESYPFSRLHPGVFTNEKCFLTPVQQSKTSINFVDFKTSISFISLKTAVNDGQHTAV